MNVYYHLLGIKSTASNGKVYRAFEKKMRKVSPLSYEEYLKALLILGDDKRRKFYSILINHELIRNTIKGKEYAMHLKKFEKRSSWLFINANIPLMITEREFWSTKGLMFGLRITGLYFLFGDYQALGHRLSVLLCLGYFIIHYGLLILFISFGELRAIPVLVLVFLLVCIREYRFLRQEYYRNWIVHNSSAN